MTYQLLLWIHILSSTLLFGTGIGTAFHGWMAQEEVVKVLRGCDVFVLPSLRECGSSAIVEAMALGKPVIGTDWGGNPHLIDPGSGIWVEPSARDAFVAGLADAMLRLALAPELRAQLGAGGRNLIQTFYFDWESKVDRVLEILAETVERSGARRAAGT